MREFVKMIADANLGSRYKMPPVRANATFVALIGALFFSVCTYGLAQESNIEIEEVAGSPQITGFRSAQFGMSESETLEAIRRDFQLQQSRIANQTNDEDRTSSLVATVDEIFAGSEPAQVAYIHGYKQNKLIQVNVVWGSPVIGEVDPQTLVTTANVLRKYFVSLGFDPDSTVVNTRIDDRVFIVFRGVDEQGRMALLQLISNQVPAADGEEGEESEPQFRIDSLLLSYIEDIKDPDIFRIEKGDF